MTEEDGPSPTDLRWSWDQPEPLRWLLVDEYTMGEPTRAVAVCVDIDGLFLDPPPGERNAPAVPLTLLGCRPEPPLRAAMDALARGAGNPGGALHRRQVTATILSVATDGTATEIYSGGVQGSVAQVRPSALGDGLFDVAFDCDAGDPMPSGARQIWEHWRAGRPTEPNEWAGYDAALRHQWSGVALSHRPHGAPDRPPGMTYDLDGRHVTDIEGFYCAIGEAINGPGGYFGWNSGALHDCVLGGFGATRPFRLVWHDAAIARAHLVPGQRPSDVTMDDLLRWLAEDGVDVQMR